MWVWVRMGCAVEGLAAWRHPGKLRVVCDPTIEFEAKATERALREWCDSGSIELAD